MRKRSFIHYMFLAAFAAALLGCASKPKAPVATDAESSSIQAEATGLAPTGAERFKTIDFALLFGSRDSVASWSVSIIEQKQKTAVKTVKGDSVDLPDKFNWDGKADSGLMAPEGTYTASLAVDYAGKYNMGIASSKPFILDITAPSANFAPNPAQFAYSPNGITKPIAVNISVKQGLAKAISWGLDIFDQAGTQVKSINGSLPSTQAGWDGKTDSGSYVETAKTYPAVLTVSDEYGNSGSFKGAFSVADVPSAQPSAVNTRRAGFSPTSTSVKNSLDLLLTVGSKDNMQSWKVQVLSVEKGTAKAVRTFMGDAKDIPDYVRWDGKDDSGNLVSEGSYYASLAIDYGKAYKPIEVKSRNFSVVMTPPTGSITVDPPSVSPSEIGSKKPVNFIIQAKSAFAQIASWVLAVYDPSDVSITVFNGNWPNNKVAWDGKTVEGGALIPGTRYTAKAKVQDEYGNVGEVSGTLAVEGLTAATEPSTIDASSPGFAPTGDGSEGTIAFQIAIGDADSLASWKVDIVSENGMTEKTFKGTGKQVPSKLEWDGKIDNGGYAPEGRYTAMLSLDYGVAFAPVTVETKPFILDLTQPSGSIALSSDLFSPDGTGTNDTETITLSGSSALARIVGWSMTVYDPGNNPFVSWKDGWPANPIAWDGKGANGDLVESASDYSLVLKLRDEFGNIGTVKKNLATDILVLKSGDGYRIRVSSIVFKAFTADYKDVPADRAARNVTTLDLLAAKLKLPNFTDYKIRLEGHAVMINWDSKVKGDAEQKAVLIPLSKSRADAIENALIDRGISADRLVTTGVGASDPVVPDSDFANRWKNRRVEFYLLK
jgi:flagellar hook assembly protein FlgD